MIEFVLDVIGDLSISITRYQASDDRSGDIRAFISFYDSIKEIEFKSEQLIKSVEDYMSGCSEKSDFSYSRKLIRNFACLIYDLVEKFGKSGFRYLDEPLELFKRELVESFVAYWLLRPILFRSLIELSAPDICFDQSLPTSERCYFIRVLDYQKYNYSVEEVQKQWKALLAYWGIPDILRIGSFPRLSGSGDGWMSEARTYDAYQHRISNFRRDKVQMNESFLRSMFSFKILSFTDGDELNDQIQKDWASLQRFRRNREDLQAFLANQFSMSDFF